MVKGLLEIFERVIALAKRTEDPKVHLELEKIGNDLSILAKDPTKVTTQQLTTIANKLDQIDPPNAITIVDEIEAPSVTNRPQGKSAEMKDSAERSIQFVAEKTGLSFEEARLAIMEKMNEGYAIGDPKRRRPNELASIKAYLDTNLDYSATDAIMFLEDIEEIAFSGAIDLASDTAKNVSKQNAKQIIDSSLLGDEFGETLIDFDNAPKTLEDTFENVPPDRRSVMEEMYAPIIEEQKIIEATQKEIQQTAAKIQDLIEQGRVDEAEALAESLKDFQTQLKSTDSALDATIIPPNRTLNAKGGRVGLENGGGPKIGRRAFLGGLGAGIASLFIPRGAAKVATTAAKAAPEIAAQGMPNWFPLLVNKIKKQGKQTKVATGGRNPENVYTLKDGNTEYILTEDSINGSMDVSTRGDDYQQVSFEYIPPTEYRRPDGKAFTEDSEFYASEFLKGGDNFSDYENTLGGIDDLKLGINSIEEFAKAGNKTPAERLDEIAADFKTATTKEDIDGFAKGGRVGYKNGGGVGTLFKEKRT
jgi:hypothetical protein